jgi:hypothetical protein
MDRTNRWISNTAPLLEWDAVFPPPKSLADVERLLHLTMAVLEVGEREAVYRVSQTEGYSPLQAFDSSTRCTYAQHVEKIFFETGDLLPMSSMSSDYKISGEFSKICYYDQAGEIVEEEVDSLGEILKRTRQDVESMPHRMAVGIAPVKIYGNELGGKAGFWTPERYHPFFETTFTVQLFTDIWFPQVIGFAESDYGKEREEEGYDNRELALCHTPRFNRFLLSVRQLVLDYGGTWSIGDDVGVGYGHAITENGIILEP